MRTCSRRLLVARQAWALRGAGGNRPAWRRSRGGSWMPSRRWEDRPPGPDLSRLVGMLERTSSEKPGERKRRNGERAMSTFASVTSIPRRNRRGRHPASRSPRASWWSSSAQRVWQDHRAAYGQRMIEPRGAHNVNGRMPRAFLPPPAGRHRLLIQQVGPLPPPHHRRQCRHGTELIGGTKNA